MLRDGTTIRLRTGRGAYEVARDGQLTPSKTVDDDAVLVVRGPREIARYGDEVWFEQRTSGARSQRYRIGDPRNPRRTDIVTAPAAITLTLSATPPRARLRRAAPTALTAKVELVESTLRRRPTGSPPSPEPDDDTPADSPPPDDTPPATTPTSSTPPPASLGTGDPDAWHDGRLTVLPHTFAGRILITDTQTTQVQIPGPARHHEVQVLVYASNGSILTGLHTTTAATTGSVVALAAPLPAGIWCVGVRCPEVTRFDGAGTTTLHHFPARWGWSPPTTPEAETVSGPALDIRLL
jgi:hypothetical protein